MLKSSGEVEGKYAVIELPEDAPPNFWHYFIQRHMPRHLHRVKEGLNMTLDGLKEFPIEEHIFTPKEPMKFDITFTNKDTKQLEFML